MVEHFRASDSRPYGVAGRERKYMSIKVSKTKLLLVAMSLGSFAPSAFAYLDPSTGSMILSAIVGIFATLGLALKTYWYKLKSLFGGSKQEQPQAMESAPDEADSQGP
jgi:hypothetical protein